MKLLKCKYEYYIDAKYNQSVKIYKACINCKNDLFDNKYWKITYPIMCKKCMSEMSVHLKDEYFLISLPYRCEKWSIVESSHINSIGKLKDDLIVRFRSLQSYICKNKGNMYDEFLKSKSKGKFFNKYIKDGSTIFKLCLRYGCIERAYIEKNQVLCKNHLNLK